MSAWVAKRFWASATALACEGGFTVRLDDRPVKTPAKTLLVVPTLAMAQAIAAEWDAQQGKIRPETMPCTRMANSALVKVPAHLEAIIDELAGFGGTDLLCYRAAEPPGLVARQAAGWDPLLLWANHTFDSPLSVTTGVIPVPQPAESLARLRAAVAALDPFRMTAFHDLVAITGSLVLALAVARDRLTTDAAFDLSRIDEHWQAEVWGADDEAAATEDAKRSALSQAGRFYRLAAA